MLILRRGVLVTETDKLGLLLHSPVDFLPMLELDQDCRQDAEELLARLSAVIRRARARARTYVDARVKDGNLELCLSIGSLGESIVGRIILKVAGQTVIDRLVSPLALLSFIQNHDIAKLTERIYLAIKSCGIDETWLRRLSSALAVRILLRRRKFLDVLCPLLRRKRLG